MNETNRDNMIDMWNEVTRLRAENEALRGLCDLQAMAIRQLDRGRQVPKDIRAAIDALRGEVEK